jgi:hypothetical protein
MAWSSVIRGLFLAAMAVFLVTIGIGILNGLDLVDFSRDQLLTHVHTGTLGWITLSLVALSTWAARGIDRRLAWALGLIIPIYALAFLVAPAIRSAIGAALLVAILWLVVWAWRSYGTRRSLPALAVALGFTTFTYGAIIGVLRQVQLAGGPAPFPSTADVVGAHASAMVFSYLILVATGLLEWRVLGTGGLPRGGLVQLGALFLSGALLSFTLLFLPPDAVQPVGGLVLLLNLVAVSIFAVRVMSKAIRTDWMAGGARHLAMSSVFVLVAMAIFLYVIYRFISDPSIANDPTAIVGVLTASDHAAFIGVITNLVFGCLLALTADRKALGPWADQVAFWGTNIGLAIFLVGLIGSVTILKQVGAPLMGVSLLVGLAALAIRLRSSTLAAAEA